MESLRKNEEREELLKKITFGNKKLEMEFTELLHQFDKKSIYNFIIRNKGVPNPSLRLRLWNKIFTSDNDVNIVRKGGTYEKLLKKIGEKRIIRTIDEDVKRAPPHYTYFKEGGEGRTKLFNILKAFSIYQPDFGYCQGMHNIGAILLLLEPNEEDAFWTFTKMMTNRKFDFKGLYSQGLIKMKVLMGMLERMIDIEVHKLHKFFQEKGITSSLICWSSFGYFFTDSLQFDTTLFVWDLFFLHHQNNENHHPWNFLLKLKTGLLKTTEEEILQAEFNDMKNVLKKHMLSLAPEDIQKIPLSVEIPVSELSSWMNEIQQLSLEKSLIEKNTFNKKKYLRRKMDGFKEDYFGTINFFKTSEQLSFKEEEEGEEEDNNNNNSNMMSSSFFSTTSSSCSSIYEEEIIKDVEDQILTPNVEKTFAKFESIVSATQQHVQQQQKKKKKKNMINNLFHKKKRKEEKEKEEADFLKSPGLVPNYGDITNLKEYLDSSKTPASAVIQKDNIFDFD